MASAHPLDKIRENIHTINARNPPNLGLIVDILQKLAERRQSGEPPEKLEVVDSTRTKKHSAWGGDLGYRIFYPTDYWNTHCNKSTAELLNDMNIWSSYPSSVMRTITEDRGGANYSWRVLHIYVYIITDNEGTPIVAVDIAPLTKAFPDSKMYDSLLSTKASLKPVPKVEESLKNEVISHAISTDVSSDPSYCRKKAGFTSGWCGVAGGGVPACDH